jgi:hypothetical protein
MCFFNIAGNEAFRFLDMSQFLAAGTSYDGFLKAFKCTQIKSYFPYEYLDSAEKLQDTALPPYHTFYSKLKAENTLESERNCFDKMVQNGMAVEAALKSLKIPAPPLTGPEKYQELLNIWDQEGMETFEDFLIYYNNLDVEPFVEAAGKMKSFYEEKGVDVFKGKYTIASRTRYWFQYVTCCMRSILVSTLFVNNDT